MCSRLSYREGRLWLESVRTRYHLYSRYNAARTGIPLHDLSETHSAGLVCDARTACHPLPNPEQGRHTKQRVRGVHDVPLLNFHSSLLLFVRASRRARWHCSSAQLTTMPDSASIDGLFLYVADDADFDSIAYGGGEDAIWQHTSEGWDGAYKNTGSEGVPGGTASMNFTGLAVLAFAAMPANLSATAALTPPNVTVTLDGDTPTKVTIPVSTESPFFTAGPLNDGITHTITIRIDQMTDEFPFALDGIIYAAEQNTTKPPSQDTLTPDSSTSGYIQGLLPVETTSKQDSGPPVGPIVGGVIGGTALIVIVALVVWYLFIRPRRRGGRAFFYAPAKISDMLSGETVDAKPEPYPLMHPTSTPSMSQVPARQGTLPPTDPSDAESGYGYGVGMGKPGSPYAPSNAGSSEAAAHRRKAELAGVLSVPQPTTYHADSGIRFSDPSAAGPSSGPTHDLADVPPTYSEK